MARRTELESTKERLRPSSQRYSKHFGHDERMRPSTRQRRHLNGSSNASQDRPASGAAVRSMTAPRSVGEVANNSDSNKELASIIEQGCDQGGTTQQGRRPSGAVTARRPQTAHLLDEQAVQATRRRVHSARGEITSRVAGSSKDIEADNLPDGQSTRSAPSEGYGSQWVRRLNAVQRLTSSLSLHAIQHGSLPTLSATSRGAQPTSSSQENNTNRGSFTTEYSSTPGAAPVVQWAVAVDSCRSRSSTPNDKPADASASRSITPPTAFEEFGALLRDRYEGKRSLRAAFLNWDSNKDGRMSHHEVRKLIHTLGFNDRLGSKKVEAVLDHVASLPNSSLHYEDFCRLINKPYEQGANADDKVLAPRSNMTREAEAEPHPAQQSLYPDVGRVVELLRRKYQARKLRTVFRDWDGDKDGYITESELDSNLRRQGVRLSQPQLRELFGAYDADGDGRLLYHEFINMINGPIRSQDSNPAVQARVRAAAEQQDGANAPEPYPVLRKLGLETASAGFVETDEFRSTVLSKLRAFAPRLNDAYAAFDDDHSGNLSYMEFRQGLQQVGLHFTEREFFHLATAADTDGSGEISFKEFCQMFIKDQDGGPESISWPKPAPGGSRGSGSAGSFDFSHLTRRARIPTRCGKTPYYDTGGILRHSETDSKEATANRFSTEARIYGSNQSRWGRNESRPAATTAGPPPHVSTTLGQEEKQRRDAAHINRLQRIRQQLDDYKSITQQSHAVDDEAQARRVRTIQRQAHRYQEAIDQQHPRYARQQGKAVQARISACSGLPWG